MKVLLFTNLYPSITEPTRGTFNQSWFTAIAHHCEVRVISPQAWWTRLRQPVTLFKAPCDDMTGLHAAFPAYWSIPGIPALHSDGMYHSLKPLSRRIHREYPFDVIVASWAYPDSVAAARLARELKCPLIVQALGSDINEIATHPSLRNKILAALQYSSRIIAVSGALGDKLEEMGVPQDKIIRQHNAVDGDQFLVRDQFSLRRKLKLPLDKRIVCYVGNFKTEKGTDILMAAWGKFQKRDAGKTVLILIGGGSLETSLRAGIKELGIENTVQFHGRLPHEEIPDWIGACNVFCLPSLREGCPNVVLEALACGRPVVASKVGGIPELLNERNGIMTPPGDAEALAQGIEECLNREWNPRELRESVGCLSWDVIGERVYGILKEVVEENA